MRNPLRSQHQQARSPGAPSTRAWLSTLSRSAFEIAAIAMVVVAFAGTSATASPAQSSPTDEADAWGAVETKKGDEAAAPTDEPKSASESDEAVDDVDEPKPNLTIQKFGPPPIRSAPSLPPDVELKALAEADPRYARRVLRRAARTAPRPRQRAFALRVLGARDPSRATSRICARALRIDASAGVRRAAAECLGRMPERVGEEQTSTLIEALDDDNLDVVTMAGWAIASVGSAESLSELARRVEHPDERVGRHFTTYANRLKARHGLNYIGEGIETEGTGSVRLVPEGAKVLSQLPGLELAASTSWLGLYGGMTGWLQGGLFTAAYGGGGLEQASPLMAMGGVVVGLAAGGSYGFFRADQLHLAHNVVQLGTAGMLAGYGAGLMSGVPPASGVNSAGLSLLGNTFGVGLGVLLNETAPPTAGALSMGMAVGFGSALSAGAVAGGYKLTEQRSTGLAMLAGGTMALVSTTLLGPYEFGLLPSVGATVGGLSGALVSTLAIGLLESSQLEGLSPFTEGAGWGVAAGYALGAVAGASTALFIPEGLDPLKVGSLKMDMPTIGAVADQRNPGQPLTIARLGGRF